MSFSRRHLTDAQWELLDSLIPEPPRRKDGRGRPWRGRREVLDGILFILRTGAAWADLPERYPPYQTCHRRFQQWVRSGVMRGVLDALAEDLRSRGGFDLEEAFIDGSFAPAKKGAPAWAKPSEVKGLRSWQLRTGVVFLSPFARRALRRTKLSWCSKLWRRFLWKNRSAG